MSSKRSKGNKSAKSSGQSSSKKKGELTRAPSINESKTSSDSPSIDKRKTKDQLIKELSSLRRRVHKLEKSSAENKWDESDFINENVKFDAVISSISDGISIQAPDFRILYQNKAHEELTDGNHVGKFCYKAYAKSEDVCEGCPVARTFKDGGVHTLVKTKAVEDGMLYFEIVSSPLLGPDGNIVAGIEILRDITELRRSKEELKRAHKKLEDRVSERTIELQESEERFREVFHSANDAIWLWELNDEGMPVRLVDVNNRATEMLGYTKEELLTMTPRDFVAEEFKPMMALIVKEIQEKGQATYEMLHITKDGRRLPVEISSHTFYMGDEKVTLSIVRDITERRLAEEALKESEAKYRSLYEHSLIGISISRGNLVIAANKAVLDIFGYDEHEFLELPLLDHVAPESREFIRERMEKRASGEHLDLRYEYKIIRKDGEIRDIEISTGTINIANETYVQGTFQDITERKRADKILRESEERYRSFVENFQGIAFRGGMDFIPEFFHGAVEEVTGYTEEDFKAGNPRWVQIIPKEDMLSLKDSFEKMKTVPGQSLEVEHRIVCKNGEIKWVCERIQNISDDSSAPTHVQGVVYDITERKQAEEALRESRNMHQKLSREFNTLLDAIPDAITLIAPDLKVMWANNSASLRAGMESDAMQGEHCYGLFYNRHFPCNKCPTLKTFRTGKASTFLDSIPDGRFSEIRTYPIMDDDGDVRSVIEIIIDITEKMSLQAETMRTGHLASIGELAAGVAHEINNPLNSIINYAQVIINESNSKSLENDISGQIKEEGERIANIVKNLLSFARGSSDEERKCVHMLQVILDTLSLTQASMRKSGINLEVDVSADMPEVLVNHQQIQQVFLNIINNARYALNQKYPNGHDDKKLHIKGREVLVGGKQLVRMTFHDQGTGISKDNLDKVMNPFFSTKPTGSGTGLGLSISHSIVNDHGGMLSIDSTEDEYTRVTLDIPVAEKK
jgi:PAS domain S-box-containing protein